MQCAAWAGKRRRNARLQDSVDEDSPLLTRLGILPRQRIKFLQCTLNYTSPDLADLVCNRDRTVSVHASVRTQRAAGVLFRGHRRTMIQKTMYERPNANAMLKNDPPIPYP